MQDLVSLFHDLSNKILLLTSTIECQKRGLVIPEEKVSALVNRVLDLSQSIRTSLSSNMQLTYENADMLRIHEDMKSFLPELENTYSPLRIILGGNPETGHSLIYERSLIHQIVENAVENSFKAGASTVLINLSLFNRKCRISLIDDGDGFPGAGEYDFFPLGFGSRVIHNNVVRINGEASYACVPSGGTCLTISLPIFQA